MPDTIVAIRLIAMRRLETSGEDSCLGSLGSGFFVIVVYSQMIGGGAK